MPGLRAISTGTAPVYSFNTAQGQPRTLCPKKRYVKELQPRGRCALPQFRYPRIAPKVCQVVVTHDKVADMRRKRAELPARHEHSRPTNQYDAAKHGVDQMRGVADSAPRPDAQ